MLDYTLKYGMNPSQPQAKIFMADGNIQEEAPPEEFFNNPKNQRLKDFLSKVL